MALTGHFRHFVTRSATLRPDRVRAAIPRRAALFQRLDWDRLTRDPVTLAEDVSWRESGLSVQHLTELLETWKVEQERKSTEWTDVQDQLLAQALRVPNRTSPAALQCGKEPKVIRTVGQRLDLHKPKELHELCEPCNFLKTSNLGTLVGSRSYILQGPLAELEQALIRYTVKFLKDKGFQFISVPDLLYGNIIEDCGFPITGERNMVYELERDEGEEPVYLSGTAEMGIAAYLSDRNFRLEDLPLKLVAVSRCFRAETSSTEEERGIYRVHNFTKVEMFGVTANETERESEELQTELVSIQESLFTSLGLHYQVMEMPANDLGTPAYRKHDIEAWMPGRQQYGEISSCSNCTDFQARRLNIRYSPAQKFAHTVNGTACAIPRMIIALVETYQDAQGRVNLPDVIREYMHSDWNLSAGQRKKLRSNFLKNRTQQLKVTSLYDGWCAD